MSIGRGHAQQFIYPSLNFILVHSATLLPKSNNGPSRKKLRISFCNDVAVLQDISVQHLIALEDEQRRFAFTRRTYNGHHRGPVHVRELSNLDVLDP